MSTSETSKSAGQAPSSGFERKDPYVDSTSSAAPTAEQISTWANEFFRSPGLFEEGAALNTDKQDGPTLPPQATPAAYQSPAPQHGRAPTAHGGLYRGAPDGRSVLGRECAHAALLSRPPVSAFT